MRPTSPPPTRDRPTTEGRPCAAFFPDGYATADLRLVEARAFECGVAFQRWALG